MIWRKMEVSKYLLLYISWSEEILIFKYGKKNTFVAYSIDVYMYFSKFIL